MGEAVRLRGVVEPPVQQREQVLVEDLPLLVREGRELLVQLVERCLVQLVAELAVAPLQRVPPGVLAQHQAGTGDPHFFGADDLVGESVLQHAVLVDSRLVGERVPPHDRLVWLGEHADHVRQELAGPEQLLRIHAAVEPHRVRPNAPRDHDLLERGVAGPLPDAVDRAFDLAGPGFDRCERVGDGEPQVVVAMRAEHDALRARHPLLHGPEHRPVFDRERIADGVREIDRGGALLDRRLHHPAQELEVRPGGVFRRELDVVGVAAGAPHRVPRALDALLTAEPQLALEMQVGRRDEHVHPRSRRGAHGLTRHIDVPIVTPGERRDHRPAHRFGDRTDGPPVAVRRAREAGFDHVHSQDVELTGQAQLLLGRHRIARRLLAIPQRRVEDDDVSPHESLPCPHRLVEGEKKSANLVGSAASPALVVRCYCFICPSRARRRPSPEQ